MALQMIPLSATLEKQNFGVSDGRGEGCGIISFFNTWAGFPTSSEGGVDQKKFASMNIFSDGSDVGDI